MAEPHNTYNIVICPNCGQKNRIQTHGSDKRPVCAKCWSVLPIESIKEHDDGPVPPPPPYKKSDSQRSQETSMKPRFPIKKWLWLLVVAGFFIWVFWQNFGQDKSSKRTEAPVSVEPPRISYPAQPLPANGAFEMFVSAERVAPFEIRTDRGANYLVKLVSVYNKTPVMAIFIRAGNTVTVDVPLGTYELRYATGETWYGYDHLFGPDTVCSKADEQLEFKQIGYQVSGYTVTLYEVPHGNLHTTRISPQEF